MPHASKPAAAGPAAAGAVLVVLFALAALTPTGCASDGAAARARQEQMLDSADTEGAKIVVLEVTEKSGRLTASEGAVEGLRRSSMVMDARRGPGRNEVYVLVAPEVKPDTLVLYLEDKGYRGKVLQVVSKADLATDAK